MDPSQCWRPSSDTTVPENRAKSYHPYVELFDLTKDPWEQKDVAEQPAYALVRADLLGRLRRQMVETKDPLLRGAVTSPQHLRAMELLDGAK
jgi:hypothetical protein